MKMNNKIIRLCRCVLIFALTIMSFHALQNVVSATETEQALNVPANWPWRGMTVLQGQGIVSITDTKQKLGANAIRLTIWPTLISKRKHISPDDAWRDALEWLDVMLDVCRKEKMTAVVTWGDFSTMPNEGNLLRTQQFWKDPELQEKFLKKIEELAKRYAKRGEELGAYQINPEPEIRENGRIYLPDNWLSFQARIIEAIRKFDSRWIDVTPGVGGQPIGYRDAKPLADARLIYGVHMYVPHAFTHQGRPEHPERSKYPGYVKMRYWDVSALRKQLSSLREFQMKYKVPVLVGEFSAARWAEGAEQYLLDVADIFEEYGWSWFYHAYGEHHAWNPDYNTSFATDDPKEWKPQYVGASSVRWKTLMTMFKRQ